MMVTQQKWILVNSKDEKDVIQIDVRTNGKKGEVVTTQAGISDILEIRHDEVLTWIDLMSRTVSRYLSCGYFMLTPYMKGR